MSKVKMQWNKCSMLIAIVLANLALVSFVSSSTAETPALNPIVISANYSFDYSYSINSSTEYVFLFAEEAKNLTGGATIYVESEDADNENPLIVVVRQKKGILSWQVPLLVENRYLVNPIFYPNTSRTLCPSQYYKTIRFGETDQYVTVSISTASRKNISFFMKIDPLKREEFYMK